MQPKKAKLHFQRFEFKYQIPENLIDGMIPEFLKYMDFDDYAEQQPGNSYKVASLYYDSAGLDSYYQKLAGVRTRKKLRVRFYDKTLTPQSRVFVEIKKKYDSVVVKDRITLNLKDCVEMLFNGKPVNKYIKSERDQEFMNNFLWILKYNGMTPQNMVVYERKPFISKLDSKFRVTIDSNLKTHPAQWLSTDKYSKIVNPGLAVLEVKFNNVLPFWFHQIIQRYGLEQRPFSKYCQSLELCHPHLVPQNRVEVY